MLVIEKVPKRNKKIFEKKLRGMLSTNSTNLLLYSLILTNIAKYKIQSDIILS